MNITAYNKLPVIITGPGLYVCRNGKRVKIHAVELYNDPKGEFDRLEVTAFEAKGAIEKMFRGKMSFRGLDAWHVSGRYKAWGEESPHDIVSKE